MMQPYNAVWTPAIMPVFRCLCAPPPWEAVPRLFFPFFFTSHPPIHWCHFSDSAPRRKMVSWFCCHRCVRFWHPFAFTRPRKLVLKHCEKIDLFLSIRSVKKIGNTGCCVVFCRCISDTSVSWFSFWGASCMGGRQSQEKVEIRAKYPYLGENDRNERKRYLIE